MMRALRSRDLLSVAVIAVMMSSAFACRGPGQGTEEEGQEAGTPAETPATAQPCLAPASWFPHDQTPEPDNTVSFTMNCQFHQWSWQTFLWLTQTLPDGELRFESFASPPSLFTGEGEEPAPFAARGAGAPLRLAPRTTKSQEPTLLDEINQAGSLGLLVDQNQRAVYYSIYFNDVFYDFVREHDLFDPEKLAAASPTLEFPVGSLELKAAWKVVGEGEDTTGFYTRQATISELVEQGDSVVVDPTRTDQVTVALVGLHIAGVTEGHPEFIWATFEHEKNAPTLTDAQLAAYLDTSNTKINQEPVSDQSWTFYAAGTPFVQSNQNNAGMVRLTDPAAQTLTPVTNAFIQYAQGGGSDSNRAHIRMLNGSVLDQLQDPIFDHYYLGGAIWLNQPNALVPNSTQQDLITGSTDLSNVTMETFTQKIKDQRNCFNCHNTLQRFPPEPGTGVAPLPGLDVNVSHVLVNNYFQASQRREKSEPTPSSDPDEEHTNG